MNHGNAAADRKQQEQLLDMAIRENMARIKHKIIIMSGKGGVGKSTVATNLAFGLAANGFRVGLMDTDIPVRTVVIEQGHFVNRPSKVIVEVKGDTDGIDQVKVSGTGIVVLKGTLYT